LAQLSYLVIHNCDVGTNHIFVGRLLSWSHSSGKKLHAINT
jgi:hypothetical protein